MINNVRKMNQRKPAQPIQFGTDTVDLMEEMLFQRAASGIRPVLYLSSYTDLECSLLMLLDGSGEARWSSEHVKCAKQLGHHSVMN